MDEIYGKSTTTTTNDRIKQIDNIYRLRRIRRKAKSTKPKIIIGDFETYDKLVEKRENIKSIKRAVSEGAIRGASEEGDNSDAVVVVNNNSDGFGGNVRIKPKPRSIKQKQHRASI